MAAFASAQTGVYNIALHNQQVRELVKQNLSHDTIDDRWADVQHCQVVACSEGDARAQIEAEYPASNGFVIDKIGPRPTAGNGL